MYMSDMYLAAFLDITMFLRFYKCFFILYEVEM
jgi:hypothetical protein